MTSRCRSEKSMKNFQSNASELLPRLSYEFRILKLIGLLFGIQKAAIFAVASLTILRTGKNRSAYRLLGACTTNAFGTRIELPHPEPRFIEEIVLRHCYTPTPDFQVKEGMVVLDVGANVGIFTIYAASRNRTGRIVAIEPDPESFSFLRDNIRANGFANIQLLNAAIGANTGKGTLVEDNPGSVTVSTNVQGLKSATIRIETISSLVKALGLQKVDLLKVDAEGAEFEVIEDTSWAAVVSRVVMEVHHPRGDYRMLVRKLSNVGYRIRTSRAYDNDSVMVYGLSTFRRP